LTSSTEKEPDAGSPARISAGRVGRPHGLDGGFHVTGARARLLGPGVAVQVGDRALVIERRGGTEQRPVLHLDGVGDRDAVAALRGLQITVAVQHAPELGEGEFWAHELEGCLVCDGERSVGMVTRLIELPSCEALEVSREQQPALLVPMVKDAIRSVDMQQRRIDVDLGFIGDAR
jgi:16S rRNA processing protein RimM